MRVGRDGKPGWRFNASSAEQANAWFGGYHPIVREMPRCRYALFHAYYRPTNVAMGRYNFYLDEMITMRNRAVVAKLEARGESPMLVPEEVLREQVVLKSE